MYKLQSKFMRCCENDISYGTMKKMIKENGNAIVIDVRTRDEYRFKHLDGAINIPMQNICERIEGVTRNRNDVIILYCEYGSRSKKACNKLRKIGYVNVFNMSGGIEGVEN